jgi:2-methylcitrate dehydratase PrpD
MAKQGFIGPATIFEGRDGFLHGYSDDADASKVTEGLGDTFYITKSSIKPHACCRYKQGPIDCLLEIVREHSLKPEEVEKVTVGALKAGFRLIASPEEEKRNPQNVVAAQFSMPFGAAVSIIYGRASLEEYTEDNLSRPEVKGLMDRVQCVQDPALEENFPSQWPAWVEVDTRDGRNLRADVIYPKGDPENALSWDELKDKFRVLTGPVISSVSQEQIIKTVESLEDLEDIRALSRMTAI